jgi:hypothetical protein
MTYTTMALMDLCGISNLTWDANPHYLALPTVADKLESGHLQNNGKQQEIEVQRATLTILESYLRRRVQTDGFEHRLQTESHKSASPSSSAPQRH